MDREKGWIKLHRKMLDNPIFENPKLLKMWIWCLLKASHKDKTKQVGLNQIKVKQGQFITGRIKGAQETNLNPATWYKYLKALEKLQYITLNSNNKMTVVTIVNWEKYQSDVLEKEQQSNNKVATKEQQSNNKVAHTRMIKNDKNGKNDKNIDSKESFKGVTPQDDFKAVVEEWNFLIPEHKIHKITQSSKRGKMLNARLKEYGVGEVLQAIKKVSESSFLRGQNKNGWSADFEWMVKPNNFIKVIEDKYKDKPKKSSGDDWERKLQEALDEID